MYIHIKFQKDLIENHTHGINNKTKETPFNFIIPRYVQHKQRVTQFHAEDFKTQRAKGQSSSQKYFLTRYVDNSRLPKSVRFAPYGREDVEAVGDGIVIPPAKAWQR